ncbi:MAG: HAMP domain-containing sensor histidine kinase [Planctomycetota bacterium]
MKPKLAIIFLLIVLVPLALLAWLGARILTAERQVIRHQFVELLTSKLHDTDQAIAGLISERERLLMRLTEMPGYDTEALRDLARKSPLINQVFVLDPKGELVHPPPTGALSDAERNFLRRARRFLVDKELTHGPAGADTPGGSAAPPDKGWYVWYWENGLSLIFWRRAQSGHIVGVELEGARLLADIIARLPGSEPDSSAPPRGSIALLDSNGSVVYQWGNYAPPAGEKPRADVALSRPLNAWHLHYYVSSGDFGAGTEAGTLWALGVGLLVATVALLGLAVYFYREYSRDVREAAQRVNFVNQVSHELKTPLTNIRMYAELLDGQLPPGEEQGRERQYLSVIVAESQRLSRLITNVLTFARKQRQALTLHRAPHSVDAVIDATLEQFRPALEAKGVEVHVQKSAPATVLLDSDAVGQILGNLFSNVEKYGASGKLLEVASSQAGGLTTITVSDRGPGIPSGQREKIFQPFYRISNKLSDGVTGAGIGLTIARDLARLHGGDVQLDRADAGARFCVTLQTPGT